MGSPIECWVLKVTWSNGAVGMYPHTSMPVGLYNAEYTVKVTHPITGTSTYVNLAMARDWTAIRATLTTRPKDPAGDNYVPASTDRANPLNRDDHYEDPSN